jgi:hypothetical protein
MRKRKRSHRESLYKLTNLHTNIDIMKLFYVLALVTATAIAAPTEVESSQVLVRVLCSPISHPDH